MSFPKFFAGTSKAWKPALAAVFITAAWLSLWYFPWQSRLHHIFWLQLGVALVIFIVPGLCVYGLLSDSEYLEFNHVTFGFVLSHLIFALLGILGRFIHLSFETIKFLIMTLGLILLLGYILPKVDRDIKFQINREMFGSVIAILPILLVSIPVILIVIQRALNNDDLTYLAYVTRWQYSSHLDFNNVIFGESQVAPPRFWLMSAPFAQALLADLSQIPGILILGGYYEPFLVVISVLCWYELAIALKCSPKTASAAVILQLSFLLLLSEYLHPGAPYFDQLSADKATAAFILAPVFFQSLIRLLENSTRNNIVLFLLTGLSLTFMHPIILAYSVFIGGMLILFNRNSHSFRNKWLPLTLLIVVMLPQIMIRFAKVPATAPISFDPEVILDQSGSDNLVARWGTTRYYGFNPDILTMKIPYADNIPLPQPVLEWGWILLPIFAAILTLKRPESEAAHFIAACFILCFLAGFPFTGWILGYFLNARMLARSVWLFPYGLSVVFLMSTLKDKIGARQNDGHPGATQYRFFSSVATLILITLFSTALFLLYLRENNLPDLEKFQLKSIRYQGLATAGQELDRLISSEDAVMGSQEINDLIPGISSKSRLVTFRTQTPSNMAYFTPGEREARISDTQKIFSGSTSAEAKISLLRKYNIHFLLLQRSDLRLFNDLISSYPEQIKATEIGGVYLVQID